MKFVVMENSSLSFLVTWHCALSHTHPNGYGLWCGIVSKFKLLTMFSKMRFAWEPLSKRVSIFLCYEITLMWKSYILFFSFGVSLCKFDVLVLAMDSFPFIPMDVILVSSPESDPKTVEWLRLSFVFPCYWISLVSSRDEASNNELHHDPLWNNDCMLIYLLPS